MTGGQREALDQAAIVVRIYRGLAEDESDGEFALWSETQLCTAIVEPDMKLIALGADRDEGLGRVARAFEGER